MTEMQAEDSTTKTTRHRRSWVWLLVHAMVYLPMRLWVRTHTIGADNMDPQQGGILLINHQSYLDPLFCAVRLNRAVSYLARDTLFKVPVIGWICRNTFVIPISRTAFRGGSVRTAVERVENGYLVGIYPEGTRSSGPPEKFRPGFLSLVRRTETPIYPVAVVGADRAMPKGSWWIRPAKVTIVYGEALSKAEVTSLKDADDDKAAAMMVQEKVTELFSSIQTPKLPQTSPN